MNRAREHMHVNIYIFTEKFLLRNPPGSILLRNPPGSNTCEGVRKASKLKGSSMAIIIPSVISYQGMHIRSLS